MSKKIQAIANFRVSSDEQMLNGSLPRQEKSVRQAAKELDVEIVRYWSGSVSSKKWSNIDRDDLEEMLTECKRNRNIRYAIFDELDRFMRSMLEIGYFIVLFQRLGVQIKFASQPNLKTDTAADTLMLMLEAFKAEGSNEERQKKSIDGHTTALQEGRYTFVPKPGYMRGRENGIHEIHPVRGPALQRVLLDVVNKRVSPTQGLIDLNNSDFMLDGHSKYKMDKFRQIAKDPYYAGVVWMDKQVKCKNESGLHEPLITLEQHYELVRIFAAKRKNQNGPRKNGNPEFPLNNIVSCELCIDKTNNRYVGYNHGNGTNNGRIYQKYRCRACNRYLPRHELHEKIADYIKSVALDSTYSEHLLEALNTVWKQEESQTEQDIKRIKHKIYSLGQHIKNQVEAATDRSNEAIKDDILLSIVSKKEEITELQNMLDDLEADANEDKESFMRFALEFFSNINTVFLDPSIPQDTRMQCKQSLFPSGFYLDRENKVYTPEISPFYRLEIIKKGTEVPEMTTMVRVKGL